MVYLRGYRPGVRHRQTARRVWRACAAAGKRQAVHKAGAAGKPRAAHNAGAARAAAGLPRGRNLPSAYGKWRPKNFSQLP